MLRRAVRTPFTGRVARLPPALFERFFHTVVGPAAALSYVAASAAGQGSGPADAALCKRATPLLQQLYGRLRAAGQAEAERGGRGVVFASDRPSGGRGGWVGGRELHGARAAAGAVWRAWASKGRAVLLSLEPPECGSTAHPPTHLIHPPVPPAPQWRPSSARTSTPAACPAASSSCTAA